MCNRTGVDMVDNRKTPVFSGNHSVYSLVMTLTQLAQLHATVNVGRF